MIQSWEILVTDRPIEDRSTVGQTKESDFLRC